MIPLHNDTYIARTAPVHLGHDDDMQIEYDAPVM